MRILVFRGGALGDFLVTLPALGLLRRRWPEARIELAGNRSAAELAVAAGYLDAAHSESEARWGRLFSASEPLPGELAGFLGSFDLVVSYWLDPDGALRQNLAACGFIDSPETWRPGRNRLAICGDPRVTTAPAAAHFCHPLTVLACGSPDLDAGLPVSSAEDPLTALGDRVAIHPGSGSPGKNWPLEGWVGIARQLRAAGRKVFWILGEAEERLDDSIRRIVPAKFLLRRQPLPTLARFLRSCGLFLGHDSGVSHLAAAVGCPCLLLFGPTDPEVWAPRGPGTATVLRAPAGDLGRLEPQALQDALRLLLPH